MAVRAQTAVMLFDCGDDAQRQLMQQPQLGHIRINRIFITSCSSENIFGLPGELPCHRGGGLVTPPHPIRLIVWLVDVESLSASVTSYMTC